MKYGIEVEGTFKGEATLFIEDSDFPEELNLYSNFCSIILDKAKEYNCTQIQIYDKSGKIPMGHPIFRFLYSKGFRITFDIFSLSDIPPPYIHVLLTIDYSKYPDFWFLKETDQIKFNKYRTVFTIPLKDMHKTIPSDFDSDILIEAKI